MIQLDACTTLGTTQGTAHNMHDAHGHIERDQDMHADYELAPQHASARAPVSPPRAFSPATLVLMAVAVMSLVALCLGASALRTAQLADQQRPPGEDRSGVIAVRLLPGDDLLTGVMRVVRARQLRAAWIVSCVGSLTQYAIRFANEPNVTVGPVSHFEIVSLVGTMTANDNHTLGLDGGAWHLHISVADATGRTIGGHLAHQFNSTVYTTAEIVIGFACGFQFERAIDGSTPWDELQIVQRAWC